MGWNQVFGTPRERFARQALRVVRQVPGVRRATFDREKYAIAVHRDDDATPAWLYLSNVFHETRDHTPAEQADRLAQVTRILTTPDPGATWETVRGRLRPVLRPQTFGLAGPVGMQPLLSRAALPYLHELVVIDQPDSIAYVTSDHLGTWNVTVDEVFAAARANLAGLARRPFAHQWPAANALVRMVDDGDGYFTSMLLDPGWLAEVAERVGAPVLAFAPDTHTLLLCGLPDDVGPLYAMVEEQYRDAVRSVSPVGYTTDSGGNVIAYAPPPGHPHEDAARRARALLAAEEYAAQTAWLTQQHEQAGIDVHVAELLAVVPPNRPAETTTTWSDTIVSLLPAADSISFVRHGEVAFRLPWSVVADHVDLQPELLLTPARYRVTGWPPPDVVAMLRAHRPQ